MNQKSTGFGRPANKEGKTDVWKTLPTMLVGAVGLFGAKLPGRGTSGGAESTWSGQLSQWG